MKSRRFVLLEPNEARLKHFRRLDGMVCYTSQDIIKTMPKVPARSIWISFSSKANEDLLQAALGSHGPRRHGKLLALKPPRPESVQLLQSFFSHMAGIALGFKFLSDPELVEALNAPPERARGLIIGGMFDAASQSLALIRGNLKVDVVALAVFKPNLQRRPDPAKLGFDDYGQSVRLGNYEASADSILYEVDRDYRRRLKEKRLAEEKTFGASLRRLRLLKGLTREDFHPLAPKTITRIEMGAIDKPHGKTMNVISARLGVAPEEIETY